MKKMRKSILLGITMLILSLGIGGITVQAEAATTITSTTKTAAKNGLIKYKSKYYFFVNGKKVTNTWKTISKKRYYFGKDGAAVTGWQTISKKKYYFDKYGVMKTGWQTISKKKYYFDKYGVMKTGWQTISKKKYYFASNGVMTTGWKTISNKKYYFASNGVMKTGWCRIGTKDYYFASNGVYSSTQTAKMRPASTAADQIIKEKVTATDNTQKLKQLFDYMVSDYGYARVMKFTGASGWYYNYAKDMFQNKKGSCYHYAAAYAVLAKRATGLPVRVCWGDSNAFNVNKWQKHGWVEIKIGSTWYTFDPNAADFSSLRVGKWFMQKRSSMEGTVYKTTKYANVII